MDNGHAFEFLENVMEDLRKEDRIVALDRYVYLQNIKKLDALFAYDTEAALILNIQMHKSERVVVYQKKEVGSLFRFNDGYSNATAMVPVDYLFKLPSLMTLNNAQIVELEFLLSKAGETLGTPLPAVVPATDEQQKAVLLELALSVLRAKPKRSYDAYVDTMKAAGTPVTMNQTEFFQFAEEILLNP